VTGTLGAVITGAAAKKLVAVEASMASSNQHEFNGVAALRQLFGEERQKLKAKFIWCGDSPADVTIADDFVTWYDAREAHRTRSEYRLYFPQTDVSDRWSEGDFMLLLRKVDGSVLLAFAPSGSSSESQLQWLFGLAGLTGQFQLSGGDKLSTPIGFAAREILEALGIEIPEAAGADSDLEGLLDRFGETYPRTLELSDYARALTDCEDPRDDPDAALVAWLEREEALFRQLERHIVRVRLREGFGEDVDAFVSYSLTVQNRRKSRIGYALEHHAEALFLAANVRYTKKGKTEGNAVPDFLFPSIEAYRIPSVATERLTMLGVKSTCKERWRQILAEADRIPDKHLLTLEPGISVNQTNEMVARRVTLVLPKSIHQSFKEEQRDALMTVKEFLTLLRQRDTS